MRRIFFAALLPFVGLAAMAQEKDITLAGSGKIITKNVDVKPFNAMQVKGIYELVLAQGDKEGVKLEADDNLMYLFDVKNDGGTLVISMPLLEGNHNHLNIKGSDDKKSQHLKVFVTFKVLKNLDASLIGSIQSAAPLKFDVLEINNKNVGNFTLALTAEKLILYNKGVGSVTLKGSAEKATVINTGVGSIKGEELVVQTMNIENTGVGGANVNVVKDLTVKDSFLGKVKNTGSAKTRKMEGQEI